MGYGGTVNTAIARMKENRAMQKGGNKFRGDKKDLYFKHPDSGESTFQAKELTEAEWTALRRQMNREILRRRLIDVSILFLALVSIFVVVKYFMY